MSKNQVKKYHTFSGMVFFLSFCSNLPELHLGTPSRSTLYVPDRLRSANCTKQAKGGHSK